MGTIGAGDREHSGAVGTTGAKGARRKGNRLRLAASALFIGLGCLDVLGDVNVDSVGTDIRPIKVGNNPDCVDAGPTAAPCRVSCEPGVARCADNLLQRCNSLGDGWTLIDQCASAALCDLSTLTCGAPACAANEYRCTPEGALQLCSTDRTGFGLVRQCTSAAFCSAAPGRELCTDTPCRAGRERCNGPQIEKCREDRSGYDVVGQPCASAALCVEGADQATCEPATCVPGTFVCDGANLTRCSDDANRYIVIDNCGSPDLCDITRERCASPNCTAGAQRCSGNVLQRCSADLSGFDPIAVCASAALCDPTASQCLTVPPGEPPLDTLPDPTILDGADYDFIDGSSSAVLGLGPLELRVPEQWTDVDASPWTNAAGTVIGPRFIASTDAARFARSFDIPGVYFAATEAAPVDVDARQREFDLSPYCTAGDTDTYEDELYAGTVETWTNCGVTAATTAVVVAVDKDRSHLVTVVIVTMTAGRDRAARDRIWNSFVAD